MRFFEGTRAPLLMYRRTTALAGALSVLVLGSPLMTGCSDSAGNIHFTSAGLKYARGNYQGAIADYNKAIEINPQYANAYYNRGLTKRKLGDT
jgi:tetratricopeptide (TPR) repeat protein|tara:strand:- start:133 stop:411 length:279 start_codon:yes stop_codon:yes gene_type:complete